MKKISIVIILILTAAGIYGYYQYNRPSKTVENTAPTMEITGVALIEKFKKNRNEISEKLSGKTVLINGTITMVEEGNSSMILLIDQGIKCELATTPRDKVKSGEQIQILGFYSGYDEMFNEISFVRCKLKK